MIIIILNNSKKGHDTKKHPDMCSLVFFFNTVKYQIPGNSAGDLFGMVSSRDPFKGES